MNIGEQRRVLRVEPIVDPVPDRDFPDRPAEVPPPLPRPTPRSGAVPTPRGPVGGDSPLP
ncbi:hypothetical protein EV188_101748 [Actinomycetospora succinea]|uniref:Uncharacterized protein n=1 Tax=Actinomycetospora succinea TaxID=663603 RepID=A0A4R6VSA6_9PSEU|nr:hypothetical protein [Actinomycetospora succinea]TDQ65496.1 hypothetical protein EV188_101748 [Actinomycetospora succinea]